MQELRAALVTLFQSLEAIGSEHEELHDEDVRTAIQETLNYYFVWGKPIEEEPCCYRMFTEEGDTRVAEAVSEFLEAVDEGEGLDEIPTGQERLDFLQDDENRTGSGATYDSFMGHLEEPLDLEELDDWHFEPGEYEQEPDEDDEDE